MASDLRFGLRRFLVSVIVCVSFCGSYSASLWTLHSLFLGAVGEVWNPINIWRNSPAFLFWLSLVLKRLDVVA